MCLLSAQPEYKAQTALQSWEPECIFHSLIKVASARGRLWDESGSLTLGGHYREYLKDGVSSKERLGSD